MTAQPTLEAALELQETSPKDGVNRRDTTAAVLMLYRTGELVIFVMGATFTITQLLSFGDGCIGATLRNHSLFDHGCRAPY